MIKFLPGDVLLGIFDFCRMDEISTSSHIMEGGLPWKWHRLAHVCRTWREIILASSRYLNLELLCTHRTPVRTTLGYLLALPIIIYFPGWFTKSDEGNFIAVLRHPDRVRIVELGVDRSLAGMMTTVMQEPFPALTRLRLESKENKFMPVIPDVFLGGCAPKLQEIYLVGVPFPAAPTLLLSSHELTDVELHDIPDSGYISPEAIAASLAVSPRLKCLTLGFRWEPSYHDRTHTPITRVVLPALTSFYFAGFFEYLEDFVAQIDTPLLDYLGIKYFDSLDLDEDVDYEIPQLCKFIDRSDKLKLSWSRRMNLHVQPHVLAIQLLHGGQSSLRLAIQDAKISQVFGQFSAIISNVDHLVITTVYTEYLGIGDYIRWLRVLRPFIAVKALSVHDELSHHVALALNEVTVERATEVLPALELLCLQNLPAASVEKFIAARRSAGRPVIFVNKEKEFQARLELNVSTVYFLLQCIDPTQRISTIAIRTRLYPLTQKKTNV